MDSLGQCRPHDTLVADGNCVTSGNPDGSCAPSGIGGGDIRAGKEVCRQILSEILAGTNPGGATAAEYSGDARQICWVVTGSAPRPNGVGPYHCFHEFDCSDPGAVCMEAGGEVSCECREGTSSSVIEVTSVDHSSGLVGQYFNFERTRVAGLEEGGSLNLVVTMSPSGGGDEVTGEIVVWGNPNGGSTGSAHGRFTGNPIAPAAGQFEPGDVLRTSCIEANGCDANPCASADPHARCIDVGAFYNRRRRLCRLLTF